jgi:SAM-dependent methyltransferase
MTQQPTAADWAAARGEKWAGQLHGLEATLRPIDEPLIEALDLAAACRVADVGCGGGATSREVRRRMARGGAVHGFDLSPVLVDVARSRIGTGEGIAFEVADMSTAGPPDDRYDRLVSRFGVMFFEDAPAAFANLRRWLVPGGRFAFAVWGPLADNVWMTTIRDVVGGIVDLPPIDPRAPGPFRYGHVATLLAQLQGAGFSSLDVADWRGTLPIGGTLTALEASHFALASFSSFAELLSAAGDDALGLAQRKLRDRFVPYEHDGAVRMDARVHVVTGQR